MSLLDELDSVTLDCGYALTNPATNCLANPNTNAQNSILTLRTVTDLIRNPDGILSGLFIRLWSKDLSDKTKPANHPDHPISNNEFDCLVFYLNNAYQVKGLPEPMRLIFGGTTLAPTVIQCTDQNKATTTMNIRWDTLYNAAGVPPPGP